jgi:hypothetical protein
MNNNPYLFEKLTELQMQEIQREAQSAQLLREAGISKTSWLTRLVRALLNLLNKKSGDLQDQPSVELQPYRPCCDETAR